MKEYFYKILVVGDLGTGKTSILKRYIEKIFSTRYKSTIGVDFALKTIQYNSEMMISLQLWDIAGQERFGSMTRAYYRGAAGAFVVYDVTRPTTFQNAVKWKRDLDEKVNPPSCHDSIPVILLSNKIDQISNPTSVNEMEEFCKENGFLTWFDTSAKNDKNIEEAVYCLIDQIIQCDSDDSDDSQLNYNDDLVTLNIKSTRDDQSSRGCC